MVDWMVEGDESSICIGKISIVNGIAVGELLTSLTI